MRDASGLRCRWWRVSWRARTGARARARAAAFAWSLLTATAGVAQEDPGASAVAEAYYAALLRADTAGMRARSNGLLPVNAAVLDSVAVGEAVRLDSCPPLPELPEPSSAASEDHRKLLDSLRAGFDTIFGAMRTADVCVEIPTRLLLSGSADRPPTAVEFSTLLRRLPDGWRLDAFATGSEVAPAVLRTLSALMRELGEAVDTAGAEEP